MTILIRKAIAIIDGWHHVRVDGDKARDARREAFSRFGLPAIDGDGLRYLGYRKTPWFYDGGMKSTGEHVLDKVSIVGCWEYARSTSYQTRYCVFFFKEDHDAILFKLMFG